MCRVVFLWVRRAETVSQKEPTHLHVLFPQMFWNVLTMISWLLRHWGLIRSVLSSETFHGAWLTPPPALCTPLPLSIMFYHHHNIVSPCAVILVFVLEGCQQVPTLECLFSKSQAPGILVPLHCPSSDYPLLVGLKDVKPLLRGLYLPQMQILVPFDLEPQLWTFHLQMHLSLSNNMHKISL